MRDRQVRVPGYELRERLGADSAGSVWRARDEADGELVDLRLLPGPAELVARQDALRAGAVLAAVPHRHLARVRRVLPLPAGLVLVTDAALGGTLAGLLAVRGRLAPGEVVTTGGPVAQALAALHRRDLVHGAITPLALRYARNGLPLLADAGLHRFTGLVGEAGRQAGAGTPVPGGTDGSDGDEPDRPGDVHDLAAVCAAALVGAPPRGEWLSLGSGVPAGLRQALESALRARPEDRPTAAELASALLAGPAAPVRLAAGRAALGPTVPAEGAGRRRGRGPTPASSGQAAGAAGPRRQHLGAGPAPAPGRRRRDPAGSTPGDGERDADGAGPPADPGRRSGAHRMPASAQLALAAGSSTSRGLPLVALATLAALAVLGLLFLGRQALERVEPAARAAGAPPVRPAGQPSAASVDATSTRAPTPARRPASLTAAADRPAGPEPSRDWRTVVVALDELRSAAFAAGDLGVLAGVYAPGSPALARDRALLDQLRSRGVTAQGLRLDVLAAREREARGDRVVLDVTDRLPPYAIRDADGRVQEHRRGRGRTDWSVTLARVDGDWRILDVTRRA